MSKVKDTPVKETATKTATKKTVAKSSTAKATAPTTKPTAKKVNHKPLPFSAPNETATVVMPNGQTIKKKETQMLAGMLDLEIGGRGRNGESAESITQRLLGSKKKGANLLGELTDFIIKNVLIG